MTRLIEYACLLLLLGAGPQILQADIKFVYLATTTSTENSGLIDYLLPDFENSHPYKVKVISVGTGKALRLLREGDVDVVLVHARAAEEKLVNEGFGVERRDVMYNDFVIVGPEDDPAELKAGRDASVALTRIANSQALFISRGDDSGTHKKELALWKRAGIQPPDERYREVGQGMGKVLQIAAELQAYTLTDRGTWLSYRDTLPLKIVAEGDPELFNPYGILAVNPDRYPDSNYAGATALLQWITSSATQHRIAEYAVDGQQLFVPMPHGTSAQAK